MSAHKRGSPEYDPAYKYDYIYKVLVHNVNAIKKIAELYLTGKMRQLGDMVVMVKLEAASLE